MIQRRLSLDHTAPNYAETTLLLRIIIFIIIQRRHSLSEFNKKATLTLDHTEPNDSETTQPRPHRTELCRDDFAAPNHHFYYYSETTQPIRIQQKSYPNPRPHRTE